MDKVITRYGVCYDLSRTPYTHIAYGFEFAFSSVHHQRKFAENLEKRVGWLTDSMSRRFRFRVDCTLIAVFQLYNQVETRGFHVTDEDGKVYASVDDVTMRAVM